MKKRALAVLLALCIPMTLLTGCGNGVADDFFDTLEKASNQKNYQIELMLGTDEKMESGTKITGTVSKENGQAELTMTRHQKEWKEQGTIPILMDGKNVYFQLDQWMNYIEAGYTTSKEAEQENEMDLSILNDCRKALGKKYVQVELSDDALALLQKSSDAKTAFSEWYDGLPKQLKNAVTGEDGTYTLSLNGKALQAQQINWYTDLTENQEAYAAALTTLLTCIESTVNMTGWNMADLVESTWSEYLEELDALEAAEPSEENTFEMTLTEQKDGGIQIILTQQGENARYLKATITPLTEAPQKVEVPKEVVAESEVAEVLSDLYLSSKEVASAGDETETDEDELIDPSFDWDKRYEEEGSSEGDNGTELKLSKLDGYTHIKSMRISTEDGKVSTLPVVTKYDYSDAEFAEDGSAYSVNQNDDSWEVSVYNIESGGRSPEQVLQESMESYLDIYQNDWGYKINQKARAPQSNPDGTAYIAGFGYEDTDRECQATWISILLPVKGSEYMTVYEFSVYADQANEENSAALQELCQYFNLDLPVAVGKK